MILSCANYLCRLGGKADGTHKCPFCRRNIHAICGRIVEDPVDRDGNPESAMNNIICATCDVNAPPKDNVDEDNDGINALAEAVEEIQHDVEEDEEVVDVEEIDLADGKDNKKSNYGGAAVRDVDPFAGTSKAVRFNPSDAAPTYHSCLAKFMSFRDKVDYVGKNHVFQDDHLSKVTAIEIAEWMAFKVNRTRYSHPKAHSLFGCSNSMKYWKKSISYFIPHRNLPWDVMMNRDNPTRLDLVNDLIAGVVTKDTRGHGAPPKARRAFKDKEFKKSQVVCQDKKGK